MEWIFLEAFVALMIAVGIVWWTASARRRDGRRKQDDQ
jgi:hypothetical protein